MLAGTLTADRTRVAGAMDMILGAAEGFKEGFPTNTTIGVVATNGALTKAMATRVAMMVHDGYARTINPIHTLGDGYRLVRREFPTAIGPVDIMAGL